MLALTLLSVVSHDINTQDPSETLNEMDRLLADAHKDPLFEHYEIRLESSRKEIENRLHHLFTPEDLWVSL